MSAAAEPTRDALVGLARRLGLVLDAARVASDHVSTLIVASGGGVTAGPRVERPGRRTPTGVVTGVLRAFQRQAPPFSLEDQLRRARLAVAELAESVSGLDAGPLLAALTEPPRELATLTTWTAPALEHAGTSRSVSQLEHARQQIGELVSALTALDGRIRLALIRLE